MTFSEAKREFDIRYYLWAKSEFEREIEESFPTMRLFKAGGPWLTRQFMLNLPKREQLILAHSLLKRFHPNAVKTLGESRSPEEVVLLSRRDAAQSNIVSVGEEIRARKKIGEPVALATKRKLRKVMTAQFKAAFGSECIDLDCVDEEEELSFMLKRAGWIVNTFFDFGRRETILNYKHSIVSEQTFPFRNIKISMVMGWFMSFNSYLGISSQTQWHYLTQEEIEPTCTAVMNLCARFFDVLPKLLKGLESEVVKPDADYQLSSSPLR